MFSEYRYGEVSNSMTFRPPQIHSLFFPASDFEKISKFSKPNHFYVVSNRVEVKRIFRFYRNMDEELYSLSVMADTGLIIAPRNGRTIKCPTSRKNVQHPSKSSNMLDGWTHVGRLGVQHLTSTIYTQKIIFTYMFDGLTAVGGMMVKWRKYREYGKSRPTRQTVKHGKCFADDSPTHKTN